MNKLRFAIVGCGRIASKHAEILKYHLPQAELVAVCDIVKEKAINIAQKYGVKHYFLYDEMLKNEEVEIVSILTESGNHAKHTIDIVDKYKKHIVVEKPMALTLDDADKMIEICDKYDKKLFVVKQNRYNLPVIKLREALENNRFGRLITGTVRVRWCRTQDYYDQDPWRGTWALDGGVFTNQASHHIDLLEWMLGEPISVFAKGRTFLANIESEDTGVAIINFQNGAIGLVEATTATRPKDLEGSISILGEKGSVVIGGFAVNEMQTWSFVDPLPEDSLVIESFKENPPNVYGFGHIKYLEDVCDSVINNKKAIVDGIEGRKSLELINAIYESIETNKEVSIRFQSQRCKLGGKFFSI
ncbi:MAG: Gfo/Idh/MocA family oxidoreductase [Candidatus Cloacimonetes bacterium]|nr:Gfo/Idh/MocA family oxidoreductase [Candidatus Cloacimonadota bacterium]